MEPKAMLRKSTTPVIKMAKDKENVILNQFSEFGNYVAHRAVTGPALERIFNAVNAEGTLTARAYVAASGSGGTLRLVII